jgi:hypothetical protein
MTATPWGGAGCASAVGAETAIHGQENDDRRDGLDDLLWSRSTRRDAGAMQSTSHHARMPSAKETWRAPSFVAKERRKNPPERRVETDRAASGERRQSAFKTITALLRF